MTVVILRMGTVLPMVTDGEDGEVRAPACSGLEVLSPGM